MLDAFRYLLCWHNWQVPIIESKPKGQRFMQINAFDQASKHYTINIYWLASMGGSSTCWEGQINSRSLKQKVWGHHPSEAIYVFTERIIAVSHWTFTEQTRPLSELSDILCPITCQYRK